MMACKEDWGDIGSAYEQVACLYIMHFQLGLLGLPYMLVPWAVMGSE
jgi:hypothetical protein